MKYSESFCHANCQIFCEIHIVCVFLKRKLCPDLNVYFHFLLKVQAELQQLKLQQEYQQLQQQLKAQQALAQQLDLQSKTKDKTGQIKQPPLNQAHQLALQQLQVQQKLQQQVVASQALTGATVANVATSTTTAEQAQQYYKLQQPDLQQQPQLSLPHIQQQMEQQLQHLHKVCFLSHIC